MNLDEEEVIRRGNRLGWIVLIIIGVVVISSIIVILSIYKMFTSPISRKYYVLDVINSNKEEIIKLYEEETKNDKYIKKYCDSIYRIEYYIGFPDGTSYTMYCKDEDNISFDIDKTGVDNLAKYICENGYTEKRVID